MVYPRPDTPDLTQIKSGAIRAIADMAIADGNEITVLAPWTKALVAHMRDGLTPALKEKIAARWPALEYFIQPGTPHNEPDEGYIEEGFAVSFPRPR
jgi:hypothetical protein